jgi:hypothetical protein
LCLSSVLVSVIGRVAYFWYRGIELRSICLSRLFSLVYAGCSCCLVFGIVGQFIIMAMNIPLFQYGQAILVHRVVRLLSGSIRSGEVFGFSTFFLALFGSCFRI